jgi:hypothetical protein
MNIRLRLSRVAVVAILIITAIPAGFHDPRTIYWRLLFNFPDAIANVFLYFPLGLFLQATATLPRVAAFAGGLSAFIEVAQLFFVRRNSQPSDVICNVLGAVCGSLAGRFFRVRSHEVKLGTGFGVAAIAAAGVWSAIYLLIGRTFPPYAGRGSIAVVAFLCAGGLAGILKPRTIYSRTALGIAGGAIGAAVLLPVTSTSVFSKFAIGILFGIAFVYCTQGGES